MLAARNAAVRRGGSGSVGFEVVQLAKAQSHYVRALWRSPRGARKPAGVADEVVMQDATAEVPALHNIDVVVSALGAPVSIQGDKRRYRDVDLAANLRILEAARSARAPRFVFVPAHVEPGYRDTAYIRAHEDFVEALLASPLSATVIRPTGIFPALNDFVDMARKGMATVIGDGRARTNPVHHRDVAQVLLENLSSGPAEVSVGGPDILTRARL